MACHNINLVHHPMLFLKLWKRYYLAAVDGLSLPIVYNTGGYDSVRTLQLLDGIIDIYMPDMKYSAEKLENDFSGVPIILRQSIGCFGNAPPGGGFDDLSQRSS